MPSRCSMALTGRRFLDDLSHELVEDDAELDAIVQSSTGSPHKSSKS